MTSLQLVLCSLSCVHLLHPSLAHSPTPSIPHPLPMHSPCHQPPQVPTYDASWYKAIKKPTWTPPNWVFPAVWIPLKLLQSVGFLSGLLLGFWVRLLRALLNPNMVLYLKLCMTLLAACHTPADSLWL
jgi:hypothetical protein